MLANDTPTTMPLRTLALALLAASAATVPASAEMVRGPFPYRDQLPAAAAQPGQAQIYAGVLRGPHPYNDQLPVAPSKPPSPEPAQVHGPYPYRDQSPASVAPAAQPQRGLFRAPNADTPIMASPAVVQLGIPTVALRPLVPQQSADLGSGGQQVVTAVRTLSSLPSFAMPQLAATTTTVSPTTVLQQPPQQLAVTPSPAAPAPSPAPATSNPNPIVDIGKALQSLSPCLFVCLQKVPNLLSGIVSGQITNMVCDITGTNSIKQCAQACGETSIVPTVLSFCGAIPQGALGNGGAAPAGGAGAGAGSGQVANTMRTREVVPPPGSSSAATRGAVSIGAGVAVAVCALGLMW
ncbi:hypothetical protein HDU96_005128 [Phlyctochytrium bullatum]|nr:hypothetical protein HDU96_005128 [Phlyctochytrium bullatum]